MALRDRLDALGERPERSQAFTGSVLDPDEDPVLQAIVSELCESLDMPIGLVSLVLERVQYFRAHHGLPADLAEIRATDRDISFCQLVVRDGSRLEVNDAPSDERVPQDLVKRYGIRSYIGHPLKHAGHILGSLCAIDTKPREFNDEHREIIQKLGTQAQQRLAELARADRYHATHGVVSEGLKPAFAELRNAISPLGLGVTSAQVSLAEIRGVVKLARYVDQTQIVAAGSLDRASMAVDDLASVLNDLEESAERVAKGLAAIERALIGGTNATLHDVLVIARGLASHWLDMLQSGRWPDVGEGVSILSPAPVAAATISVVISRLAAEIAAGGEHALHVDCSITDEHCRLVLTADRISAERAHKLVDELAERLRSSAIALGVSDGSVVVDLTR